MLKLEDCALKDAGAAALGAALAQAAGPISELSFRWPARAAGAGRPPLIARDPGTRRENDIGDAGGIKLLEALGSGACGRVASIDVSHNRLGDGAAQVLAVAVGEAKPPPLLRMQLSNNQIGDKGVVALADAVCRWLPTLAGAEARRMPQLSRSRSVAPNVIDVSGNPMHSDGAAAVTRMAQSVASLQEVRFLGSQLLTQELLALRLIRKYGVAARSL